MCVIQLPTLPDLYTDLRQLLDQVPYGHVTTYGDLAKGLGNVIASRWVASCLLHDEISAAWPSHRVVRVDGSLGLYAHGDADDKAEALRAEGVRVSAMYSYGGWKAAGDRRRAGCFLRGRKHRRGRLCPL